ncbi:pyruvate, water dikinase regulatory protein [Granulosicoccus antarcticus]|uniref:Putative phosphoenolpyruvate synthase regulatory protein n=1 Tax=Granulosicoccus antarcticus IMCC3135 TaxID=1192854 RepID=A0A2Z2P3H2_9GAMM|nr:pyruvate, water dikinase regulatory protein [Granulosicoccus antarcticus]ASJ74344.1 Phosphoenolpyruvate synthase regulatory protein [Granulosicoccus antarcticus IMCC3135]
MPNSKKRYAFIVSDRTGLTAEAMAHSLLSQFPEIDFKTETFTFVDTAAKAGELVKRCHSIRSSTGHSPLVFLTMVNEELRSQFKRAEVEVFDLFDTFIGPMEQRLGIKSSHTIGRSHGVTDEKAYTSRIAAVHFALQTDDGMDIEHYRQADLIIVGVSRCGKTPTSLYLSLHYGLYVSNYPLTDHELEQKRLPEALQEFKEKLFGLTIDPFRLLQIRQQRFAESNYSTAATCQREIAQAEALFRSHQLPWLNTTRMSVEEIGAMVVNRTKSIRGVRV